MAEYAIAKAGAVAGQARRIEFLKSRNVAGGSSHSMAVSRRRRGQSRPNCGHPGSLRRGRDFRGSIGPSKGARVIGTTSTPNVDFVKSLGADLVVDYKKGPVEAAVKDAECCH